MAMTTHLTTRQIKTISAGLAVLPNLLAIVHPPQVTAFHPARLLTSDQAPTPAPKRNVNSLSTTSSRVADLVPATKITVL